jgi:hypothetical protein
MLEKKTEAFAGSFVITFDKHSQTRELQSKRYNNVLSNLDEIVNNVVLDRRELKDVIKWYEQLTEAII